VDDYTSKQKWNIDRANRLGPGDPELLIRHVHDWELAVWLNLGRHHPERAAAFKRMGCAARIGVLLQSHLAPAEGFDCDSWPRIAGGGWSPSPNATNIVWP
jgi:hypothetical protein